jgi:hypothetical protein
MQPLLSGKRQTSGLGDRNEIAKVSKLHGPSPANSYLQSMTLKLQSLFQSRQTLVPSEMAFVAGAHSSYITGASLTVDGGTNAQPHIMIIRAGGEETYSAASRSG